MENKHKVLILLILVINIFNILSLKYKDKNDKEKYMFNRVINLFGQNSFVKNVNFKRPVNIPLRALVANKKIVQIKDSFPTDFLIYKTSFLTPVMDQGMCGSCWSIVITNMLADRLSMVSGGDEIHIFSTQQLLQCYIQGQPCKGESPEDALFWCEDTKFEFINDIYLPYNQADSGSITSSCPKSYPGIRIKKDSIASIVDFIEEDDPDPTILQKNIENMKNELFVNGPFYCAMTVYQDLFNYNGSEIYKNYTGIPVGGHAIEIIGYCEEGVDTRPGYNDAYWICKNTWGVNWPIDNAVDMNGYFAIKMGINECGIESRSGSADLEYNDDKRKMIDNFRFTNFSDFILNNTGFFSS